MARPTASGVFIEGAEDAAQSIKAFEHYPKLLSWLVLHVAGLPTLPGLVVTRWDDASRNALQEFASRVGSGSVLLRSDSSSETGRTPRGGYVLPAHAAGRHVRRLLAERRVVFILEPASPLDDLYSLCLEPQSDWRRWTIEIVGPGFDASDLKRGDVTPHERVEARLDAGRVVVSSRVVASLHVQAASRAIRFDKIAALFQCDVPEVEETLRRRGETMLLDVPRYEQIPSEMIDAALEYAAQLRPELVRRGLGDRGVSISMSFVGEAGEPVFWDVVWPHAKYVVGDV